jgi:hypothetical protein
MLRSFLAKRLKVQEPGDIMNKSDSDGLYGEDHVPDPVTEGAVAAAMAATDRPHKESVLEKFAVGIVAALFVIASIASVLSFINSMEISQQNSAIKKQTECLTSVVAQFEKDQLNRVAIGADDRDAIRDLVNKVFTGKTVKERIQAFKDFNARNAANDVRRGKIPTQLKPACNLPGLGVALPAYNPPPLVLPSPAKKTVVAAKPKPSSSPSFVPSFTNSVPFAASSASVPAPPKAPSAAPSTAPNKIPPHAPNPVKSLLCRLGVPICRPH